MPDIVIDVPPTVLGQIQRALQALHRWNAAILQARETERIAEAPGRYEYDIVHGMAGAMYRLSLTQAQATLAEFEARAPANGVDPQAVYDALGGKPVLLEEGPAVHEWHPSQTR